MNEPTGYMPQAQTVEWSTPQELFDKLNEEFGFTIDVAATAENAKTPRFYTEETDGLAQSWDNEIVWCNPPYGRVIKDWVKKASTQLGGGLRHAHTLADRYGLVSRSRLWPSRNSFYSRTAKIRGPQVSCAISEYDSYLEAH